MIKKKCILIFFLCLTFISCSSLEQTKKNLNSWLGEPESNLIQNYGVPVKVYETGGKKYVTYVNSSFGNIGGNLIHYKCEVTFTIENQGGVDVITHYRFAGNNCASPIP